MRTFAILFVTFLALVIPSYADLPIHCLNSQISGKWVFERSAPTDNANTVSCGYVKPDNNRQHFQSQESFKLQVADRVYVQLLQPNKAVQTDNGVNQDGTWTMVYDEGFDVAVGNYRYFAFSKYKPKPYTDLGSEEVNDYISMCSFTMIGWYRDEANSKWGCWRGIQTEPTHPGFKTNALSSGFSTTGGPVSPISSSGGPVSPVSTGHHDEDDEVHVLAQLSERRPSQSQRVGSVARVRRLASQIQVNHRNTLAPEQDTFHRDYDLPAILSFIQLQESVSSSSLSSPSLIASPVHLPHHTFAPPKYSSDLSHSGHLFSHHESIVSRLPEVDDEAIFQPSMDFVDSVNSNEASTWRAGIHEEFVGKRMKDMLNMLGARKYAKTTNGLFDISTSKMAEIVANVNQKIGVKPTVAVEVATSQQPLQQQPLQPQTLLQKGSNDGVNVNINTNNIIVGPGATTPAATHPPLQDNRPDEEKYAGLPENFDWRNKDGTNYDSPVRNQGSCGSCYAVASVYAMESRFRIASNNRVQPSLSPQNVLSCSFYNQGCQGGYPYLVAKHGVDFGFVEESCFPYTESNGQCSNQCPNAKKYFLKSGYYVGGFYGGCSEVAMMKELYQNGPMMVAFQAPPSLFYYRGGVFMGPQPKTEEQASTTLNPWQQTNHAVVAVGWGVDKSHNPPVKYWVIKNTWGATWGENGYFRIRRGTNECAIESMASAGIPSL